MTIPTALDQGTSARTRRPSVRVDQQLVVELHAAGCNDPEIARRIGCATSAVYNVRSTILGLPANPFVPRGRPRGIQEKCPRAARSVAPASRLAAPKPAAPLPPARDHIADLFVAIRNRGPLTVAPGERWCTRCGEIVGPDGSCHRCGAGGALLVAVGAVLRAGEYVVGGCPWVPCYE